MREKKWTPGPWKMKMMYIGRSCLTNILNEAGKSIAKVVGFETAKGKANAHLIAAAPDLVEALERLLEYTTVENVRRTDMLKIKAALAKAYGE